MNKMIAFTRALSGCRSSFTRSKQLLYERDVYSVQSNCLRWVLRIIIHSHECRVPTFKSINDFRYMSLVRTPPVPPVITGTAVSKDETRDFMAVFPDIVRDITDTGHELDIPEVNKWISKVYHWPIFNV